MIAAAFVAATLGINAGHQPLESIARPLSAEP
jgi:hypothetical protein